MKIINIQEAKTHLSRLVEDAVSGGDIVISKSGKPLVKLVPYSVHHSPRQGGFGKGQIWESEDCWASADDLLAESVNAPLYAPFPAEPVLRVAEEPS